jgi:hypothetical protein
VKSVDAPRLLIAGFMLALLVAVLGWLQGRFNHSDVERATRIVSEYRPRDGGRPLVDAILEHHPGVKPDEISWDAEILSGCLGHVRVHAYVPAKRGAAAESFAFDVDLNAPSVHPTDPKTVAVLRALTATTARTGTTAPP